MNDKIKCWTANHWRLTGQVNECEGYLSNAGNVYLGDDVWLDHEGLGWFKTQEAAIAYANDRRIEEIERLRARITTLENMVIR